MTVTVTVTENSFQIGDKMKIFTAVAVIATSLLIAPQCFAQDGGDDGEPGNGTGLIGVQVPYAKVILGKFSFAATNNNYHSFRIMAPLPYNPAGQNNPTADVGKSTDVYQILEGVCNAIVTNNTGANMDINVSLSIVARGKAPNPGNSKNMISLGGVTATKNLANGEIGQESKSVPFEKMNVAPGGWIPHSGTWKIELNDNP